MKVKITRDEILDLEGSLKKEYLLTNGLGGYASSSILDCNRRKYHGLLILPLEKLGKTFNLLSKLEPTIVINKNEFLLSTNKFPGVNFPTGHQYVEYFELEYFPVTKYMIGDMEITKSILMPRFSNSVLVRYDVVKAPKRIVFRVNPLLSYREIHFLSVKNMNLRQRAFVEKNGFKIDPYEGLPALYIQTSMKSVFFHSPEWWSNFEYLKERHRGYAYQEDLFSPGIFELKLKQGDSVIFRASIDKITKDIETEWDEEVKRLKKEHKKYSEEKEPLRTMKAVSEAYIVENSNKDKGIIAGYHWFGEWGRDTLISLTGLTLCTGKADAALNILKRFSKYEKDGLLPNVLGQDKNYSYNCIDSSLWFFWAVQNYLKYTGDKENVEKLLFPTMKKIITAFLENKVPNVGLKDNGLLYAGNENTQLTWMDATAYGKPVTPRNGAPVEINALWYNALKFLSNEFGGKLGKEFREKINYQAALFENIFTRAFWNEKRQCLDDVYREYGSDISIRPNQLFAIGLPYNCVENEKALSIIRTVQKHLVTAYGLRTLSPEDPMYQVDYRGDQNARDSAYHQGMIWPWLIGIYCDALFIHNPDKKFVKQHVYDTFKDLWEKHLSRYGLLHISEIFKPTPPNTAKGCIAQAWNMAEIIRVLEKIL